MTAAVPLRVMAAADAAIYRPLSGQGSKGSEGGGGALGTRLRREGSEGSKGGGSALRAQ